MDIPSGHQIQALAPGKFIISGEYSVVFGKPAIAAAIDVNTFVTIRSNSSNSVKLHLKVLGCTVEWHLSVLKNITLIPGSNRKFVFQNTMVDIIDSSIYRNSRLDYDPGEWRHHDNKKTIRDSSIAFLLIYLAFGDIFGDQNRFAMDVTVESEIPVGSGLGSSSAYSVSLIGALNRVHKEPLDLTTLNQWAFEVDKFFHGKPSGVDNSVISHGGYIFFKEGKIIARAKQNPEILVMLIDTRVSRSTKTMSLKLKTEREANPSRIDEIFENISEVTEEIWARMTDGDDVLPDPREIDNLLSMNHTLLEQLGVGHDKLTHIKNIAKEHGIVAKLSGAGCGGGAFFLYHVSRETNKCMTLKNELVAAGYMVRSCSVGSRGLVVKTQLVE